jgi:5-methylcytosine-specific restriction endonuclease McrA
MKRSTVERSETVRPKAGRKREKMRICTDCKEPKELEELAKDKRMQDGRKNLCKQCQTKRVYAWKAKNPERFRQHYRDWAHRHPEYINYKSKQRTVRKRELADGHLPSGFRTTVFNFYGNRCLRCETTENLTIDHVVPLIHGGRHAVRNMQVLCHSCNSWKEARHSTDYRKGPVLMWFLGGPRTIEIEAGRTTYIKLKETA